MEMTDILKKHFADVEKQIGGLPEQVRVALCRLDELEQKGARPAGPGWSGGADASWGHQLVDSDGFKSFASDRESAPKRFRLNLKTTITSDGVTNGIGASAVNPLTYLDGGISMPQRRVRVRDLIPSVRMETATYSFAEQTARTNNAATVAETLRKPESAYGWTLRHGRPVVIAHWVPASVQILDDAPQLAGLIDSELRYGLQLREDAQLLYGDGNGENVAGLCVRATPFAAPFTMAGMTMIDQIALALLQATLNDFNPTGVVMHPSDFLRASLVKDTTGSYIMANPAGATAPTLWGRPVAQTPAIQIDKFLVGDMPAAATLYDRWEPRVEVSTEHADFFTRNLVAIRAEERIGLATKQPAALIYGDFGNVT